MDVVRLGAAYTTVYQPDELIEGYSSMIWTERSQESGEFEMKTPRIAETLSLLPENTLISHRDTEEVMIVENHSITEDENGNYELTITGQSFKSFLNHRFVEGPYGEKRKMAKEVSAVGACAILIWNAVDNASGKDVTREGDFPWGTSDQILNVSVTDSVAVNGNARRWRLTEGILYPQLMNIMIRGGIGLRMIRPSSSSKGTVVSIKTAMADRGDIVRTYTTDIKALRFDLFDGLDRSHLQNANPRVAFNRLHGHIGNATYLLSNKDFKTALEVMSSVGGADVYRNDIERAYTGLRRRVMSFDGGSPELPSEPEKPEELRKNATAADRATRADAMDKWLDEHAIWKNKRDAIVAEFKVDNADDALRALKIQRRVSMFTGDISPIAPYQFKRDYNLGDSVTLYGDYGQVEIMVVNEYIRTEDAEGDRGYPGLTTP